MDNRQLLALRILHRAWKRPDDLIRPRDLFTGLSRGHDELTSVVDFVPALRLLTSTGHIELVKGSHDDVGVRGAETVYRLNRSRAPIT